MSICWYVRSELEIAADRPKILIAMLNRINVPPARTATFSISLQAQRGINLGSLGFIERNPRVCFLATSQLGTILSPSEDTRSHC